MPLSQRERGILEWLQIDSLSPWERVGVRAIRRPDSPNRGTMWACSRVLRQFRKACPTMTVQRPKG